MASTLIINFQRLINWFFTAPSSCALSSTVCTQQTSLLRTMPDTASYRKMRLDPDFQPKISYHNDWCGKRACLAHTIFYGRCTNMEEVEVQVQEHPTHGELDASDCHRPQTKQYLRSTNSHMDLGELPQNHNTISFTKPCNKTLQCRNKQVR